MIAIYHHPPRIGDIQEGGRVRADSYYALLGISPTASSEDIRAAYRRVVKNVHPDMGGSADLFHLIQTAYETLGDPARRREYDERLRQYDSSERTRHHDDANTAYDWSVWRGRSVAELIPFLEAASYPIRIITVAVTHPEDDGRIVHIETDACGLPTVYVGVSPRTHELLHLIGVGLTVWAWNGARLCGRTAVAAAKYVQENKTEIKESTASIATQLARALMELLLWSMAPFILLGMIIFWAIALLLGLAVLIAILGALL